MEALSGGSIAEESAQNSALAHFSRATLTDFQEHEYLADKRKFSTTRLRDRETAITAAEGDVCCLHQPSVSSA